MLSSISSSSNCVVLVLDNYDYHILQHNTVQSFFLAFTTITTYSFTLTQVVRPLCIAMLAVFCILHRFIDPGHILVEDGEADVELGCREDLEYVVMKLDDTIQNGRYIQYIHVP
jgi:hypothetical protein